MQAKPFLTCFEGTFESLKFNEKSFFNKKIGFTPNWDYKPTNANHGDSPGAHTSEKILNLSTIKKFNSEYDVIAGSVVAGEWETILFSFF